MTCSAVPGRADSETQRDAFTQLLLLCLLSPWAGLSSAQLIRPHDVVTVSEGEDALLPCALDSGQSIYKFDWRKDNKEDEKKEVFFYDRGSYYGNGRKGQNEQFKNRVMFFKELQISGNASIKIQNTRLEDSGTYTCVLLEPHRQSVDIRLNVGAAPVPYVKQLSVKNTQWLLQCKVVGVPKPEVEWRNSAGKILSLSVEDNHVMAHKDSSGRFHVDLRLNVTRSDTYTCVATQRDIYHQINNTLEVHIQDVLTGWIVAGVLGALLSLLILAIIIRFLCKSARRKRPDQAAADDSQCLKGTTT